MRVLLFRACFYLPDRYAVRLLRVALAVWPGLRA